MLKIDTDRHEVTELRLSKSDFGRFAQVKLVAETLRGHRIELELMLAPDADVYIEGLYDNQED